MMTLELYECVTSFQTLHAATFERWAMVHVDVTAHMMLLRQALTDYEAPMGRRNPNRRHMQQWIRQEIDPHAHVVQAIPGDLV